MASELEEDLVFCPASVYQYVCVQEWFCPRAGNFLFPCRGAAFLVLFSLSRHICFEGQPGKERESVTATFDNRQKRNRHDNTIYQWHWSFSSSSTLLLLWPNRVLYSGQKLLYVQSCLTIE